MHVSKSSGGSPVGQPQGRCNAVDRNRTGAQSNPQIATLELQRRQVNHFTKHRCFVGGAPLAACCSQRRTGCPQARASGSSALELFVAHVAEMNVIVPAVRLHPSHVSIACPRDQRGRREGRVLAAPMARQQQKKLAAVTTGSAETPGLPCTMVLTVSFVLSLGTGLCCPHRKQIVPLTWHQRRDARTTRLLRPHWDRSSARLSRAATQHVHRIPLPTSVTTAKRPSHRVRDGADDAPDLGTGSSLFLKIRTCNLRQVGATGKFRMTRMRNLPVG